MNTTNCSQAKQELIPGMDLLIDHMKKQSLEIERLRQENKKFKELYEAQQQETDIEHQRYLETAEKYSDKLWEVCQELDIENHDTSENIIKEIKKLQEENKRLNDHLESFRSENKQHCENATKLMAQAEELNKSNEFIRKTCLMADEENTKLKEQIDELGELCENIDENAYNSWKKITGNQDEESSEEEGEEGDGLELDWICYEFVRYNYTPEDGGVYDDDLNKIADWDDQGEGKMIWKDKKYEDKHKELAKKSMANLVAMATAPVN